MISLSHNFVGLIPVISDTKGQRLYTGIDPTSYWTREEWMNLSLFSDLCKNYDSWKEVHTNLAHVSLFSLVSTLRPIRTPA